MPYKVGQHIIDIGTCVCMSGIIEQSELSPDTRRLVDTEQLQTEYKAPIISAHKLVAQNLADLHVGLVR